MKQQLVCLAFSTVVATSATLNPVLLVHFDGSVSGSTYTLASGEFDTTGTFKASATPTLAGGVASLDGGVNVNGTAQDGFDFNPATLGTLSTQNWVAETVLSFDAFTSGFRTMMDVQGDCDFRVNNAATNLEALYWDGSTDGPILTSPLPSTGTFVHYALVWDAAATSLTAYVNGVSIGTTDHGVYETPDPTNVSFGYFGRGGFDNRGIDGSLDSVAFATFAGTFDPGADFQLFTVEPPPPRYYWDINGATAGAGGESPNGNWGAANWSPDAAGEVATVAWIQGENAAFSAGADATGICDVVLGTTPRIAGSVLVEEGNLLLTGGTLQISNGGSITVNTGAFLEINGTLQTEDLTLAGDIVLSGPTTIAGSLAIDSGNVISNVPLSVGDLSGGGSLDMGLNDLTVGGSGSGTFSGQLGGSGAVTKQGTGTLTLGRVTNTFDGPLTVAEGTLVTGPAAGNGSTGYLGAVLGGRTIRVESGATLELTQANVFGGGGKSAATIPAYDIAGGTLRTIRFNTVGTTTLSAGAVLMNSSTETDPDYGGFQFLGDIEVEGSGDACLIFNSASSRPAHLLGGGSNVITVADVTGSTEPDLVISSDLINGSGDYPGAGALVKAGPGTLTLIGANAYTGGTTVTAGVLAVTGSSLADVGSLVIDGGKVAPAGVEIVETLYFGSEQQASGTWGATGSGAEHIDDSRFSGDAGVVEVLTGPATGYGTWASSFPGLGDDDAELDFEGDGLASGIEWVLGGDPTVASPAEILPSLAVGSSPAPLQFQFRRSDAAAADPGTTIAVEYGSDLSGWTTAEDGTDGVTIISEDDAIATGIDRVTVSIPRALVSGNSFFVRLRVTVAP
jgi:autotransporter-associated beta strand protein